MKRGLSFALFLFLMLLGTSAFANPDGPKRMVVKDGRMVVEPVETTEEIVNDNWMLGPINSLTLSYGAMGYVYPGYGPVIDLVYYRQKSANARQGISLRWFHETYNEPHYIGQETREYKCVQIDMIALAYQIQSFKRSGNWEYSIAGGFGLGVSLANYHLKRTPQELYKYDNRELLDSSNMGFLFWGFDGGDWEPFADISMTLALEYYFSKYFSMGVNASIHYHTFLYIDASASIQAKMSF